MARAPHPAEGRYDWFGWQVGSAAAERESSRLAEAHEYFHRQLDDTTAFGGLTTTIAALADTRPEGHWKEARDRLKDMSDLVHECYAVGLSLLTTQRRLEPIPGYPTYDGHVATMLRLLGSGVHPWVVLAALRAAATACMQSEALAEAGAQGVDGFEPTSLAPLDRPNHRLAALLAGDYASRVEAAQGEADGRHGEEPWWSPLEGVHLRPDAVDGEAADAFGELHRQLFADAARILDAAGTRTIPSDAHHDQLRVLLRQARALAPEGLTRIGALVDGPEGDLLHGGPLDGQRIELMAAPERAVVLPYGSISGLGGRSMAPWLPCRHQSGEDPRRPSTRGSAATGDSLRRLPAKRRLPRRGRPGLDPARLGRAPGGSRGGRADLRLRPQQRCGGGP